MATQAAYIAETVAGLKRALKRKDYESDADNEIEHPTNRGYKDQKRAKLTRLGRLAPPSGLETELVEYGGYSREIICRKPQLVDEDGYDVESDDDEERIQEAVAAAAEFDPYANIHIDQILAPLAAITDLPTHPTLSRPFTSGVLSQLADQSSGIMRKENQSLWKTKRLLTKLCGDFDWVPCKTTMGATDVDPYVDDFPARQATNGKSTEAPATERPASPAIVNGDGHDTDGAAVTNGHHADNVDEDGEVAMVDADALANALGNAENGNAPKENGDAHMEEHKEEPAESTHEAPEAGEDEKEEAQPPAPAENGDQSASQTPRVSANGTRHTPELPTDRPEPPLMHPLFRAPPNARPNRDVGLPEPEAEELRRLLTMWVQKQEEVCRGVRTLNEGLLQADRLRKDVLHWAKAEAHCGANREISDGEDWYDKEEWGLVEDLKKGHDEGEEEEANAATTAKKTRARR